MAHNFRYYSDDKVAALIPIAKKLLGDFFANSEALSFERIVENRRDKVYVNTHGVKTFHCAARLGGKEIVEFLLDHGMFVDVQSGYYSATAAHEAVKNNHMDLMRLLLSKGASLELKDKWSSTLLDWAAFKGYHSICAYLIEDEDVMINGAALCEAAERNKFAACYVLIDAAVDIYHADRYGSTALHYAASYNNGALCRLLLDRGADINAQTNLRTIPLHQAVIRDARDACAVLLEHPDIDVNKPDADGNTALHFAMCSKTPDELSLLLLAHGADPCIRNAAGRTAEEFAHFRKGSV